MASTFSLVVSAAGRAVQWYIFASIILTAVPLNYLRPVCVCVCACVCARMCVCAGISGSEGVLEGLALVRVLSQCRGVRRIVVKSRCLRLHASTMHSADEFTSDTQGRECRCNQWLFVPRDGEVGMVEGGEGRLKVY